MVEIDLSGRKALVTGGAAGIGRACCKVLSQAGAEVTVIDIDLEGAKATASSLPKSAAVMCDLGDPDSIRETCSKIVSSNGAPEIVVNCAGLIRYRKGLGAVSADEWDSVLNVNLRGAFHLCRELIEPMKKNGWGKSVHFSSLAARVGGIEVGGPDRICFADLLKAVSTHYNVWPNTMSMSSKFMKPLVKTMQRFKSFPLTVDQLMMLVEDNVCDTGAFQSAFGIETLDSYTEALPSLLDATDAKAA